MTVLFANGALARDDLYLVSEADPVPDIGDVLVPLARFLVERPDQARRRGRLGVWVPADGDALLLAGALERVDLVAIDFPRYADGRGYSHARHLRDVLGYEGEVRAVGDVSVDHVFPLRRCGFDAFALRDGEDEALAVRALGRYSATYTPAAWRPPVSDMAAE